MTSEGVFGRRLVALALFVVAAVAILVVLLRLGGGLELGDKYRFEAVVPTAVQLVPQADVKLAGVTIGHVERIENRGATAVVGVAIDEADGPIYRDAQVRVRAKTLIGESYLGVDPGTSASGEIPDGGLLPLARAQNAVQLDQILSAFPRARRDRLRSLLTGMAQGVDDAGGKDLNLTLEAAPDAVAEAIPVAEALAAERQHVAGMVDDFGRVFDALGRQREHIRTLVERGRATARAVAAEDTAVRAGLRELPSTLTRAQVTTSRLAGVGERAMPVLDDLTVTLERLTPVARTLPRASAVTLRALGRLETVTPKTRRLLAALRRTSPALSAALPGLDDLTRELRPFLAFLEPYLGDAGSFFAVLRSGGVPQDATSQLAHIKGVITDRALVTMTEEQRRLAKLLLGVGFAELTETGTPFAEVTPMDGINGYPAPGTALEPQPFSGRYPKVERDTAPHRGAPGG